MIKIFIDAGHGGNDKGASGNSIIEREYNIIIQEEIIKLLEKYNCDIKTSRTKDISTSLTTRTNESNKWNSDIFISLHLNSVEDTKVRGLETWYWNTSSKGKEIALITQAKLNSLSYTTNRGIKAAGTESWNSFAVLKNTKCPAILIEYGFISNSQDATYIKNNVCELAKKTIEAIVDVMKLEKNKEYDFPFKVELTRGCNVRSRGNVKADEIGFINRNTVVNVIDKEGSYYKIETSKNTYGYIFADYTKQIKGNSNNDILNCIS